MINFQNFQCDRCDWKVERGLTNEQSREAMIDHIYNHNNNFFRLDERRVKALRDFFLANGYVSYEFHPEIIQLIKELDEFLGE